MVHGQKLQEIIVHLGQHPKVRNLGLTKLWKLIYFIDVKALRDFGSSVTGSDFIKYEHGPVPSRGEKLLKQLIRQGSVATSPRDVGGKTLNEVKALRLANLNTFSADELRVIESVCAEFGGRTAAALSEASHKEPAWHYAGMRDKLSPDLMAYGHEEDSEGL